MSNYKELSQNLHLYSKEELTELIALSKQMLDLKYDMTEYAIGQLVYVNHNKVKGLTGQITKINPKRCKVMFTDAKTKVAQVFNVPKSMIESVA
jgi:hypothetical protein